MKSKLLFSSILLAGLMLANFSVYQAYGQTPQDKPVKQPVMSTCPMHSEVMQDHPGVCPKCGMKFVEKKDMPKGNMHQANDTTMMKHEHMKMMHDSTMMKHEHMKMMHDSTMMKHEHMKMMYDSTSMKHEHMDM